jgi:coenzyme F420-reducing hydrogenase beta subunit
MIHITDKKNCYACSACVEKCPKRCIILQEDKEGFLYPQVNKSICIECGICERVCPIINKGEKQTPLHIYASINKNDKIRINSSSGGLFTLLAEEVIKRNGVVFGACFDENWEVKHDHIETIEELAILRGSKYMQSRLENNFRKAETFLKQGRNVLFSGTPCQIAGLKRYLQKEYENLLTVDFICHGVPSPKIWRIYLKELIIRQKKAKNIFFAHPREWKNVIQDIEFRSKSTGWKKYSFTLTLSKTVSIEEKNTVSISSIYEKNIFMRAFLSDLILRPSCYHCHSKEGCSGADITIADFWGISLYSPSMDDDKGTSLVLLNTDKGIKYYPYNQTTTIEQTLEEATSNNSGWYTSCHPHPNRKKFFKRVDTGISLEKLVNKMLKPSLFVRVKRRIIYILKL